MASETETQQSHIDILRLGDELSVRRYLLGRDDTEGGLELRDYVALVMIERENFDSSIYGGRVYLCDIARRMRLSIRETSRLMGNLSDRGLIRWTHDGDGSEGTYLTITEQGSALIANQRAKTSSYHERVIERFGRENLFELLRLMRQLEDVLQIESEVQGHE